MTDRLCALPGCDEPVRRRPGERPYELARRICCCPDHGRAFVALQLKGRAKPARELPDGMSAARAAAVLALPEPRLRWQFEELPASEQRKVLASRGVGL